MSDLTQVYHGLSGSLKGKLKSPFLVYEEKEDAKEFANNYTDFSKDPKVIQFDLETARLLDLTTKTGMIVFEKLLEKADFKLEDIIDSNGNNDMFADEKVEHDNLDTLMYKKVTKLISENFDTIKGYSNLDNKKVISYAVMNTEVLTKKEILEIDLEGDLWKVEFKNKN